MRGMRLLLSGNRGALVTRFLRGSGEQETLSCELRGFLQLLKLLTSDPKASLSLRLGSVSSSCLHVDVGRCLLANCELRQDRGTSLAWLSLKGSPVLQGFKPFWITTHTKKKKNTGKMRNKDVQIRKRYTGLRSIGQGFQV